MPTAWSSGNFGGGRVARALRARGVLERVSHKTVIIPGNIAVSYGELEDALGNGWLVLVGPQEAADLAPFYKDVWSAMRVEQELGPLRGTFLPSGCSALAADGSTIPGAAESASETLRAECGEQGACGRCRTCGPQGQVPEYRIR